MPYIAQCGIARITECAPEIHPTLPKISKLIYSSGSALSISRTSSSSRPRKEVYYEESILSAYNCKNIFIDKRTQSFYASSKLSKNHSLSIAPTHLQHINSITSSRVKRNHALLSSPAILSPLTHALAIAMRCVRLCTLFRVDIIKSTEKFALFLLNLLRILRKRFSDSGKVYQNQTHPTLYLFIRSMQLGLICAALVIKLFSLSLGRFRIFHLHIFGKEVHF